MHKLICDKK